MINRKSCPFCLSDRIWSYTDNNYDTVCCRQCGCKIARYKDLAEAVKAWNARPELINQIYAELSALRVDTDEGKTISPLEIWKIMEMVRKLDE